MNKILGRVLRKREQARKKGIGFFLLEKVACPFFSLINGDNA